MDDDEQEGTGRLGRFMRIFLYLLLLRSTGYQDITITPPLLWSGTYQAMRDVITGALSFPTPSAYKIPPEDQEGFMHALIITFISSIRNSRTQTMD